ncbi:hypothetical protein OIU77_019361 [Salix suchowensis]|uniref:TF-B3 domain-containing protein n=2 Tax=Salix suchowensis TaxID=1278906 RepID=A0ABQ9CJU5_9ROSI|nr:B3 domain-containing protein [Salix suchowensis]KAJ6304858.1 hypothetical protein OIU78_020420 [Salix suchowensis]KAJ6398563.1 hypothetical protein OIU77_019361 [Salix suchowensis]
MSGRVKKEVEETDCIKPLLFNKEQLKSVKDGKQKSPMEATAKLLKIKRRYSDPKLKFVISGHSGKCTCCRQNKAPVERSTPGDFKSSAMIRAEEVQSNLEPAFPSFVKSLVRSHVASCFWMGLPGSFCRAHLPTVDTTVILQDEREKEYKMKYIAYKTGLSAGWRQFCVAHQLFEGDALVFQLIGSCTFKVYIIRANDLTEVDGALGLLNLDAQIKQNVADSAEMKSAACKSSRRKRPRSLPLSVVQKKNKRSGQLRPSVLQAGQPSEQSENDSEEVGSEVLEGFKLSLPAVHFKDIKSFEDFNILVDGLVLDSELSEDIRNKYYELCCNQNAFLHDNLIKGVNFKLIAGIISETVSIADGMRACTLTTSREKFATWDKALKASELFGMNVGFLRTRLSRLLSLAFDSEGATKTRRYLEARFERVVTADEIKSLEAKLVELEEAYERYGANAERLKSKAEGYDLRFQEQVLAPW